MSEFVNLEITSYRSHIRGEKPVTSYRPNYEEDFAEAMRLFILNPNLLKRGWPKRYKFIMEVLRLKPGHNKKWETIMRGAPERFKDQARRAIS